MALTPEDIANKDFSRSLRGFNENEVNDFLDEINDNYARTLDDNAALKNQLAAAQEKVKYFSGLQDALNKSILKRMLKRSEIGLFTMLRMIPKKFLRRQLIKLIKFKMKL